MHFRGERFLFFARLTNTIKFLLGTTEFEFNKYDKTEFEGTAYGLGFVGMIEL